MKEIEVNFLYLGAKGETMVKQVGTGTGTKERESAEGGVHLEGTLVFYSLFMFTFNSLWYVKYFFYNYRLYYSWYHTISDLYTG